VPGHAIQRIQSEGILVKEEGIGGSITFRKFRAPGKFFSWRRKWFVGSIVLTRKSFRAFWFSRKIINVPWASSEISRLDYFLEGKKTLFVGFDAAAFHENWSGYIEVRFSTDRANEIIETIERYGA
jgi:hypothetical protein